MDKNPTVFDNNEVIQNSGILNESIIKTNYIFWMIDLGKTVRII